MIHTRNATLIHFKQSKLSAEYIIHQRKKGIGLFYRMFAQSYFHPFFNFSPKSIRKCLFIQMRSFRETHLKIYLLPSSYPPIFKKSRGHHTKKLRTFKKTTCTKLKKLVLFLDHVLDMCWILAGWISLRSSE